MDRITANLASVPQSVKDETGKEWLVADVSMIVPGVLTSNHGSVLYRAEHLAASPSVWDKIPLIENHPKVGRRFVSVNSHQKFKDRTFGEVRTTTFNEKLVAKAWIDVAKAEQVAANTLSKARRGEVIEVSTGVVSRKVPEIGTFKGVPYTSVAMDFVPDHLAILTDSVGACSVDDGCGLNVNQSRVTFVDELPPLETLRSWERVMDGSKQKYKVVLMANEAASSSTTVVELMRADMVRRGMPADVIANELSHWQIQGELNDALSAMFTQDEPYAYVEDVYDDYFIYCQGGESYKLTYTKSDTGVTLGSDPVHVVKEVNFVPVTGNEEGPMATKKERVSALIANSCGCWKAGDEALLEAMPDAKIAELELSANEAKANKTVADAVRNLAGVQVTAHQQSAPPAPLAQPVPPAPPVAPINPALLTSNVQPMSEEQWLQRPDIPPSIRGAIEEALQWRESQRMGLVQEMTAHIADPVAKQASVAYWSQKSLPELREIQALTAHARPQQQTQEPRLSFFGQPGLPQAPRAQVQDHDMLDTPKVDWEAVRKARAG